MRLEHGTAGRSQWASANTTNLDKSAVSADKLLYLTCIFPLIRLFVRDEIIRLYERTKPSLYTVDLRCNIPQHVHVLKISLVISIFCYEF